MGGWRQIEDILAGKRREKNYQRREAERKEDTLKKNYGFNDDQRFDLCEICGGQAADVYRFRIELQRLKTRITGYPVRGVCPGCCSSLEGEGARMVAIRD